MGAMTEQDVAGLVNRALSFDDGDDDARWDIVSKLHSEGGQAALDTARELCGSAKPKQRILGADILGQVGFPNAAMLILLDLVEREEEPAVQESICHAFGHLRDSRAVGPLVRLREHPHWEVRWAVACGLSGRPEPEALDSLIELSADPDADVRNWATFGLARQTDQDFPELREALAARIDDPDVDARAEALHGLATRGDHRAVEPLLEWRAKHWEATDSDLLEEALEALGLGGGEEGGARSNRSAP